MKRAVQTLPLLPPAPPVNALPVTLPAGFVTGTGPRAPAGMGNTVPFVETAKFGALPPPGFEPLSGIRGRFSPGNGLSGMWTGRG